MMTFVRFSRRQLLVGALPSMIMGRDGLSTASLGSVKDDIDGHAMLHATRVWDRYTPQF